MADLDQRLTLARDHHAGSRWEVACSLFAAVDSAEPLCLRDRERYAEAAQICGRVEEALDQLGQVFEAHAAAGDVPAFSRTAFWLWSAHAFARAEFATGAGWVARARTVCERLGVAPAGWLAVPEAYAEIGAGRFEAAAAILERAAGRGWDDGDVDLVTVASIMRGRCLLLAGRSDAGGSVLDEAMVNVLTRATSPRTTAVVYCAAIGTCHQTQELQRAWEWSRALEGWMASFSDLDGAYLGNCRIYRATLMRMRGDWDGALAELEDTATRLESEGRLIAGHAWYELGDLRRVRGDDGVVDAFVKALAYGYLPQPGLARHHLAAGESGAALTGIDRALAEREGSLRRFELLPTLVSAALAAGERGRAVRAVEEMRAVEERNHATGVRAETAQARGELARASGNPGGALRCLRRAAELWREVEAPYEAAQVSVLIAEACRAMGDHEGAAMELAVARETFERLGAGPDLARLPGQDGAPCGLTPRELEVLRLVAAGLTNAAIAAELFLSERTVHRHVSNIFAKLDVGSRTAAATWAVQHGRA